jgi:type II secretory pathway pseudopilin PulG
MAYWELRAEQVLNRVFEPEKPIEVEFCDSPRQAPLQAVEPTLVINPLPSHRAKPGLLLALTTGAVVVATGAALVVLGLWNQSQQAIQQERNMLLIERLRNMSQAAAQATADATAEADQSSATAAGAAQGGDLPPPPPGEAWVEELAALPATGAPLAGVLRVPVNGRITSPAPEASGSSGGRSAPQLVGVVQVPGQGGSAIFQIGGSSTSAAVGESIGASGWRLRSAGGDSAVIEKGGEQLRVSISSGF